MKARRAGILLTVGAVVTAAWIFICPTYELSGQTRAIHMVTDMDQNSRHSEDYKFLDAWTFVGGEIVIWSALGAFYFLLPDTFANAFETNTNRGEGRAAENAEKKQ